MAGHDTRPSETVEAHSAGAKTARRMGGALGAAAGAVAGAAVGALGGPLGMAAGAVAGAVFGAAAGGGTVKRLDRTAAEVATREARTARGDKPRAD